MNPDTQVSSAVLPEAELGLSGSLVLAHGFRRHAADEGFSEVPLGLVLRSEGVVGSVGNHGSWLRCVFLYPHDTSTAEESQQVSEIYSTQRERG